MTEPSPPVRRPIFFWIMVGAAGLYLAVRLVEGVLCLAAWLGWGTCPWNI